MDLGSLPGGGPHSSAREANDHGLVIGQAQAANSESHAVLWIVRDVPAAEDGS